VTLRTDKRQMPARGRGAFWRAILCPYRAVPPAPPVDCVARIGVSDRCAQPATSSSPPRDGSRTDGGGRLVCSAQAGV